MKTILRRVACLAVLSLVSLSAMADSWAPPSVETTESANHRFRVTIVPRGIESPLAFFEGKLKGDKLAGQRKGDAQAAPIARVEKLGAGGQWQMLWQKPLVNDVGPTNVLLADDGSFLVTFDNWHSAGFGDDVIVIYDAHGNLVRKLSLEELLPPAYVHHLPRSVSSRWWGGKHALVEKDTQVELKVIEPGAEARIDGRFVPVRLRLADGSLVPPSGPAWENALAIANEREAKRMAAWNQLRAKRTKPLSAPAGNDTEAWSDYMFEVRDRLVDEDEMMGGMVLAAPGAKPGPFDESEIAMVIEDYGTGGIYDKTAQVFASATSDRLAAILVKALRARKPGSMKGSHLIFIGTASEGAQVVAAGKAAGASVTAIDRAQPLAPGKPLPESPPPFWMN